MEMTPPEGSTPADQLKLMSLKKEVMASVLSAGVRLNDATLRRKDEDKVGELLRKVKAKSQERVEPSPAEEVTKAELFG